ncbi:MAG: hypothetical protein U0599_07220 [Vicinamibacteria bacterium]
MARNNRKRGRGGVPPVLPRLRRAAGLLVSRDVAVLTNAIAFNFLLCLFPLLMVLVAAAQRLAPEGGAAAAVRTLLAELIPFGGTRWPPRCGRSRSSPAASSSSRWPSWCGARPASSCRSRWS